jgi:hypothetical protein
MNNESSRSHGVFTFKVTQTLSTEASEVKITSNILIQLIICLS